MDSLPFRVYMDTYRSLCDARCLSKRFKDVPNQRSIMERRDANSIMYKSKTVKQMGIAVKTKVVDGH